MTGVGEVEQEVLFCWSHSAKYDCGQILKHMKRIKPGMGVGVEDESGRWWGDG